MKKEYITPSTDYVLVNIEELLEMGASGTFSDRESSGARKNDKVWDEEEEEE